MTTKLQLPLPTLSDRHRDLYDALRDDGEYRHYGAGLLTGPQSALLRVQSDAGYALALEIDGTLYKAGGIHQSSETLKGLPFTVFEGKSHEKEQARTAD